MSWLEIFQMKFRATEVPVQCSFVLLKRLFSLLWQRCWRLHAPEVADGSQVRLEVSVAQPPKEQTSPSESLWPSVLYFWEKSNKKIKPLAYAKLLNHSLWCSNNCVSVIDNNEDNHTWCTFYIEHLTHRKPPWHSAIPDLQSETSHSSVCAEVDSGKRS